jgi:hypothetical protein
MSAFSRKPQRPVVYSTNASLLYASWKSPAWPCGPWNFPVQGTRPRNSKYQVPTRVENGRLSEGTRATGGTRSSAESSCQSSRDGGTEDGSYLPRVQPGEHQMLTETPDSSGLGLTLARHINNMGLLLTSVLTFINARVESMRKSSPIWKPSLMWGELSISGPGSLRCGHTISAAMSHSSGIF